MFQSSKVPISLNIRVYNVLEIVRKIVWIWDEVKQMSSTISIQRFLINTKPHRCIHLHNVLSQSLKIFCWISSCHILSKHTVGVNDPEWAIFSGFLKDKSREQLPLDTVIHISIEYFLSLFKSFLFSKWGRLFFNWQENNHRKISTAF